MSFRELERGASDELTIHSGATGLFARRAVLAEFLPKKEFDAIALFDMDEWFPGDSLARLREHDVDMVTGHYYRRQINPMVSIVQVSSDGTWPYVPLLDVPKSGLHEVASTGMGCVLIKREVVEAVQSQLPPFASAFDNGPLEWLTGTAWPLGQDKRFFAMARNLGYKLYLDADVRCKHAVTAWLDDELYDKLRNRKTQSAVIAGLWLQNLERHGMNEKSIHLRLQALSLEREELLAEFEEDQKTKTTEELQPTIKQLNDYDSRMAELHDWLTGIKAGVKWPQAPEEALEEYKKQRIGVPGGDMDALKEAREGVYQKEAMDFIEMLDEQDRTD
jgi:hypothetical protein